MQAGRIALDAVETTAAPKAIGPYSQAIVSGDLIFVSGQIGLEATTGVMVEGGIEPETHQVLRNLEAILQAAGVSLARVVKATVYLADMAEFTTMNTVYAGYMRSPAPARATVQVAALPRGARVEIDVIAAR